MRVAKSGEAADEIVQNVLLKLWNQRAALSDIQNLKGWLHRVTSNEALDFLKQIAREKVLADQVWTNLQQAPVYTENDYVLKDYLQLIEHAIRSLPAQQQKVYRLSREQYLTYDQIAEELDISANTVRNHMAAAQASVRKYLSRHALGTMPAAVLTLLLHGEL
jgi:RNA polymerase sigma factor (sigma-70 family)